MNIKEGLQITVYNYYVSGGMLIFLPLFSFPLLFAQKAPQKQS